MRNVLCFVFSLLLHQCIAVGQSVPINRQLFFLDENIIEVTLTTDIKKLRSEKKVPAYQAANIVMRFSDSTVISEEIRLKPRGNFRKENCYIAALMLNFNNPSSPKLAPLKKLKLVGGCRTALRDEELLLKEYLVYKMYNLLTVMSFRVRLLHINYVDSRQNSKPYSQYAFFIEDMIDMADRNNCKEVKGIQFLTEATNRQQMTLVNLFQYMIGNTDWSVPQYHNIKLMVPKNDTLDKPYAIPYDFDYAGVVDAPYALPNEILGTTSVKERVYRGFPRTMDELEETLAIFKEKKDRLLFNITNFPLLNTRAKKDMTWYVEEFYKIIEDKRTIKSVFITNARRS